MKKLIYILLFIPLSLFGQLDIIPDIDISWPNARDNYINPTINYVNDSILTDTLYPTAIQLPDGYIINDSSDVQGGEIVGSLWTETQDTLNISSSNLTSGDSLIFVNDTLTTCELEFTLRLTGGSTAYTDNSSTDTIFIKTISEGVNVNVGYFENEAFTGTWTAPKFASGIVTTQLSDGDYYWLEFPTGKLTGGNYTYILYFTTRKYN